MKRMTLNIDLKENEVFEKEIEEIIRGTKSVQLCVTDIF